MKRRKLVIDRKVWLRGEGAEKSELYRPEDKKQCCVGIYLNALGVAKKSMSGIGAAETISSTVPVSADWLLDFERANSYAASELYIHNDDPKLRPRTRERLIRDGFRANGVDVEFVG